MDLLQVPMFRKNIFNRLFLTHSKISNNESLETKSDLKIFLKVALKDTIFNSDS